MRKLLVVLISALLLPPWIPAMPASGLDPSWMTVQGHAFNQRWQFGTDLVLTYGPYGFLATNLFDPGNYSVTMAFWLVLAVAIAAGATCLLPAGRWAERSAIVVLVFVGLRAGLINDPVFFLMPLLAVFLYFHPNRSVARSLVLPLIALTALSALIKFSFALLGLPLVVLIELNRISRRRFVPAYLLFAIACAVVFFWLAGQRLAHLPSYIATSLTVAAGYSEAMQLPGDAFEITHFLGLAACVLMLGAYAEWQHGEWRTGEWEGVTLLLAFVLYIFIAFKAGFVRHDLHSLIAWGSLCSGSAVYASRYCRIVPGTVRRIAMLMLCGYVAAVALSIHHAKTEQTFATFVDVNFGRGLLERASSARDVLLDGRRAALTEQREKALAAIRAEHPLPQIQGTVDIYPWDAAVPLAHGLDYVPRPVYQSYVVYNGALMALNRARVGGERAASTLIFDMETIDNRFPSLDEGQLWPDVIAHYDPGGMAGRYLLLKRRAVPRRVELRAVSDSQTTWWKAFELPRDAALVWVTIEIETTAFGHLCNTFYKLPPLEVALLLEDGRQRVHRLVPDMARQGFLLSPLIDSPAAFDDLIRQDIRLLAPGRRVRYFELRGPGDVTSFYRDAIRVTLHALSFDPFAPNVPTLALGAIVPAGETRGNAVRDTRWRR